MPFNHVSWLGVAIAKRAIVVFSESGGLHVYSYTAKSSGAGGGDGGEGGVGGCAGGEGGSGGGAGGDAGGGRGGNTTRASATSSALSLTPRLDASAEVTVAAPSVEEVAAAASSAPPSMTTSIVTLVDVAMGAATATVTPRASSSELVSAAVSSSPSVAFAARLSAALRGMSTTNVIFVLPDSVRPCSSSTRSLRSAPALSAIMTVQPGGLSAQTLAWTVLRCAVGLTPVGMATASAERLLTTTLLEASVLVALRTAAATCDTLLPAVAAAVRRTSTLALLANGGCGGEDGGSGDGGGGKGEGEGGGSEGEAEGGGGEGEAEGGGSEGGGGEGGGGGGERGYPHWLRYIVPNVSPPLLRWSTSTHVPAKTPYGLGWSKMSFWTLIFWNVLMSKYSAVVGIQYFTFAFVGQLRAREREKTVRVSTVIMGVHGR